MDSRPLPPISDILAHCGDMILLDQIIEYDAETVSAEFTLAQNGWYIVSGSMPGWFGIEIMAQAVAAHVGLIKHAQKQPPKQGVLLGTRAYRTDTAAIAAGARLTIRASLSYRDESGLGAYDCTMEMEGNTVASATLKVFEPDNFEKYMKGNSA